MDRGFSFGRGRARRRRFAFLKTALAAAALLATLSCLGGPAPITGGGGGGSTATQIRLGDASADRILDFDLTIASPIVVTPAAGGTPLSITLNQNRIELSHLAAKVMPIGTLNLAQGSYSSVTITIQAPRLIFMQSNPSFPTVFNPQTVNGAASQTITIPLSPAITIGTTPQILVLDLNLANAIATDSNGNITGFNFSPSSFVIKTAAIASGTQQDQTGEVESVVGVVSAVSAPNFTLNFGQSGGQLTIATDSTTQFGGSSLAGINGQIVRVQGISQPDGSMLARQIEIPQFHGAAISEIEGLITQTNVGGLPNSINVVAQDGNGAGMGIFDIGGTFNVGWAGGPSTLFFVDQGNTDFTGLSVPSATFPFSEASVMTGQRIEADSNGAIPAPGGAVFAVNVRLLQQAVGGTVANFAAGTGSAAQFDLNLPADSYLFALSGQSRVHVFQQPGTDNQAGAISNGKTLRVRGLLFWTGTSFNMIARRIAP